MDLESFVEAIPQLPEVLVGLVYEYLPTASEEFFLASCRAALARHVPHLVFPLSGLFGFCVYYRSVGDTFTVKDLDAADVLHHTRDPMQVVIQLGLWNAYQNYFYASRSLSASAKHFAEH